MARRYFSAPSLRILMPGAEAGRQGLRSLTRRLRADLSRQGEVIRAPILQKSTVSLNVGEGNRTRRGLFTPRPRLRTWSAGASRERSESEFAQAKSLCG